MPEFKKDYTIEIDNLKDFITVTFVIIDDFYHKVTPAHIKNRRNIDKAIMSDSEIITLSLIGELLSIDSEKFWFSFCTRNLNDLFPEFCTRTRFHRTRKSLYKVMEQICQEITYFLSYDNQQYRIIDSMSVPVCEFGRAHFHKAFKPEAAYGRCTSKKEIYYGFKFHALTTFDGYLTDFILTPANVDNRAAVWDLTHSLSPVSIIGDKGYIGDKFASELKSQREINLITIKRKKAANQFSKEFRQLLFKTRRRIETTFSQLSSQMNIQRVLTKSKWGLISRITNKILAHNICYFINKVLDINPNISEIKELIFG